MKVTLEGQDNYALTELAEIDLIRIHAGLEAYVMHVNSTLTDIVKENGGRVPYEDAEFAAAEMMQVLDMLGRIRNHSQSACGALPRLPKWFPDGKRGG
jgi:hypothetical protein